MNLFFLVVGLLISQVGRGEEGAKVAIHGITLTLETAIEDTVGIESSQVNEKPVVLILKKQPDDGRARGTVFSGSYLGKVAIQNVWFEVKVVASVQEIDGKIGPYLISGLVRRSGQKNFEELTGVSTKTLNGMKEIVSISGWGRDSFWVNEGKNVSGHVSLGINVNQFDFE